MLKNQKTQYKLTLVYSLTLVCALFITGFISLYSEKEAIDKELSNQLSVIANLTARDVSTIIKSKRPGVSFETPGRPYKVLLKKIKSIQEISGFERVILVGRGYSVIMDSSKEHEIGDNYPFLMIENNELERVWQGESVTSAFYKNKDGKYYKSAYTPVLDESNEVIVVVKVEASIEFYQIIDNVTRQLILWGITMLMVTMLISFWVSKSIISPLQILINGFEAVERKDFSFIQIKGCNEFSYLGEKFNDMVKSIMAKDRLLELKYHEEYLRAESIKGYSDYILEGIHTGVICIGTNKKIWTLNKAAQEILHVSPPWTDTNCNEALKDFPKILTMLLNNLDSEVHAGFEECYLETRHIQKWLGITTSRIVGQNDKLLGSIAIFTDLTELKLLQDQIAIQERLAAIGQLSTGIAHEIRNPLGAIQGFVELLSKQQTDDKTKRLTNNIISEISNLDKIISEFLDFARKPEYDLMLSDIKGILDMAISFSIPPEQSEYSINLQSEDNIPKVRLDPMYIEGAFINLIKNAREAMPLGGNININIKHEGDIITIVIKDGGEGIKQQNMDKIFDPFYTTKKEGTGLGLAITHKTIKGHGGELFVKKSNEQGTTFQVNLPVETFITQQV